MKAAVFHGIEDIRIEEREIPKIDDDGILIKVSYCAICGTDVRIYFNGQDNVIPPRITGHEISGVIDSIGKNVQGYKIGDKVVVVPQIACGKCFECLRGNSNMCNSADVIGYGLDGGFAEYMAVPGKAVEHGNVIKLEKYQDLKFSCIAEPLSCVINGHKNLNIKLGDDVLIVGAGPIGTMHALLSKAQGASRVILADIEENRLNLAHELGTDFVIDTSKTDLYEEVNKITKGQGVDVGIAACSVPSVQSQVLSVIKKGGQALFFAGLPKGKSINPIDTNIIHYKEISLYGSFGSTITQHITALKLINSKVINADRLITTILPIDKLVDGIKMVRRGEGLKIAIKMS